MAVARAPLSPARSWWAIGLFMVALMFNYLDRQLLTLLITPIKEDFGASDTFMGFLTGIDKVVEGHGDINTWAGFLRYVAYTQKIVEVARRGIAENLDYVQAYDRYFATDPAMAPYTSEQIKPGLEYGGAPMISGTCSPRSSAIATNRLLCAADRYPASFPWSSLVSWNSSTCTWLWSFSASLRMSA